jgi:hypothetical protein
MDGKDDLTFGIKEPMPLIIDDDFGSKCAMLSFTPQWIPYMMIIYFQSNAGNHRVSFLSEP